MVLEARIVSIRKKKRVTQYGILTIKRGVTRSGEWYEWWDRCRTCKTPIKRDVTVILLDAGGTDANQSKILDATPFQVRGFDPECTWKRAFDRNP